MHINNIRCRYIILVLLLSFSSVFGAGSAPSNKQSGAVTQSKKVPNDRTRLFIYGSPNLEYIVLNPSGKRSGKASANKIVNEEPSGSYYSSPGLDGDGSNDGPTAEYQSSDPAEYGTYKVEFFNSKGGEYKIAVNIYDEKGDPVGPDKIIKGRLTPQESDKFEITILKGKNPTFTNPRTAK